MWTLDCDGTSINIRGMRSFDAWVILGRQYRQQNGGFAPSETLFAIEERSDFLGVLHRVQQDVRADAVNVACLADAKFGTELEFSRFCGGCVSGMILTSGCIEMSSSSSLLSWSFCILL